jgi:small subunit ribosomal protein S17e
MGRIKTKQIKRLTRMVMEESDEFTTDFAKNKEVMDKVALTRSKKIRNVVAGYAARLVKEQQKKAV